MSYGVNRIESNDKTKKHPIPRYFTPEGKARIEQLRNKYQVTPAEGYIVIPNGMGAINLTNSCSACSNGSGYTYQSSTGGASPY
jgi:hypothetical protein